MPVASSKSNYSQTTRIIKSSGEKTYGIEEIITDCDKEISELEEILNSLDSRLMPIRYKTESNELPGYLHTEPGCVIVDRLSQLRFAIGRITDKVKIIESTLAL